jgi:hypothetical protein
VSTDFADFADAADPSPAPAAFTPGGASSAGLFSAPTSRPYTKWYNLHERYTWNDFRLEGIIIAMSSVLFLLHIFGARRNRSRARAWMKAHEKLMKDEFALVGFGHIPTQDSPDNTAKLIKEKSLFEFATYGTGRQNVAFVDVQVTLKKRFNPMVSVAETLFGFFTDSADAPKDTLEAIIYPFDGKEAFTVPGIPGSTELRTKDTKSTFDGFVWSVIHKNHMKQVRDDRYDVSITFTKDNSKLPAWLTVMTENAEITEALLTPELAKAIEAAGDLFEYLIITDQPIEKPVK